MTTTVLTRPGQVFITKEETQRAQHVATLYRMQHYGGGFAKQLAGAWLAADPINAEKLMAAFGDLYGAYQKMGSAA